jgi:hypothetical protein
VCNIVHSPTYKTTRSNIPEDKYLHIHRRKNIESQSTHKCDVQIGWPCDILHKNVNNMMMNIYVVILLSGGRVVKLGLSR